MKHVLLAVNDVLLADGISRLLKLHQMTCDVVPDGLAADQFLWKKQAGVLVIDVDLPILAGLDLLRRLRHRNNAVPVILLSDLNDAVEWIHALELGADDLLRKPFESHELIARIAALLRRRNLLAEPLRCGDLMLDETTKQVRANGAVVTVSPREWAILKFMVCHSGRVVSKQLLIDAVFPSAAPQTLNTIEVHMSRLRAKLAESNACIRTVRGYGYRLDPPTGSVPAPSSLSHVAAPVLPPQ
jgi:DNA-binding response OmpR family regulator